MLESLFLRVDCISVPVKDLDAALAFYRDKLGHKLVWKTLDGAGLAMADGRTELVLRTDGRPPETDVYVESADSAAECFAQAGGKVIVGPFDIRIGRCAVVEDPWGNALVLLDSSKGLLKTDSDGNVIG